MSVDKAELLDLFNQAVKLSLSKPEVALKAINEIKFPLEFEPLYEAAFIYINKKHEEHIALSKK